jgi:hypothetical protein
MEQTCSEAKQINKKATALNFHFHADNPDSVSAINTVTLYPTNKKRITSGYALFHYR